MFALSSPKVLGVLRGNEQTLSRVCLVAGILFALNSVLREVRRMILEDGRVRFTSAVSDPKALSRRFDASGCVRQRTKLGYRVGALYEMNRDRRDKDGTPEARHAHCVRHRRVRAGRKPLE